MDGLDLECRDVVKTFGDFTAVDRVSLRIPKGSFFSILGPSGCGKTTLLRMIAGFGEPTVGRHPHQGKVRPRHAAEPAPGQHGVPAPGVVPDDVGRRQYRLWPAPSRGCARGNPPARRRGAGPRGLPDAGPKRIHQLSGGQKQRVAIARCMVLDPAVLLLDEPLGALDLKLREHMKVELKQLQHQFGTTFVYITHDQSEALVMSDRVAVMNAGRFEQVGTPQELYYRPIPPSLPASSATAIAGGGGSPHSNASVIEVTRGRTEAHRGEFAERRACRRAARSRFSSGPESIALQADGDAATPVASCGQLLAGAARKLSLQRRQQPRAGAGQ